MVGFKYKRSNIIKEEVVLFNNISYMFSSETVNMENDIDIDDPDISARVDSLHH